MLENIKMIVSDGILGLEMGYDGQYLKHRVLKQQQCIKIIVFSLLGMNVENQINPSIPMHQHDSLSFDQDEIRRYFQQGSPLRSPPSPPNNSKRQYYNKREGILYADPLNLYIQPILKCFKILQSKVQAGFSKPPDKILRGKPIKGMSVSKGEKIFGKMICGQFLVKLRKIVKYLQTNSQQEIFVSFTNEQALKWLTKFFHQETEKQKFLQEKSTKYLRKIYQHLIKIIRMPEQRRVGNHDTKQWFQKFMEDKKIASSPEGAGKYTYVMKQEIKQHNNSHEIMPKVQLLDIPRMSKVIERKTQQLVKRQYKSLKSLQQKPSLPQKHKNKEVLRINKPKCPNKCKLELDNRKCKNGNHSIVICNKCSWSQHECPSEELQSEQSYSTFDLISKGQKIKQFQLFEFPPLRTENNIVKTIESLNYQHITSSTILSTTPKTFICHYPILPDKTCKQIYKNREQEHLLPLEIKKSTIEGAGLGVFTTRAIPKAGTLVCSYLGQIGLGKFIPVMRKYEEGEKQNDSLYTLGWLEKEDLLMIAPNKFCNVGRFINYNTGQKCNLKPSICLLQPQKNKYEIIVFLSTSREIHAGQELFYNYGQDYTNQ